MLMAKAIAELYEELESISYRFEELTDTDVRDSIYITLNFYFVWGQSTDSFPKCFEMFSKEGDESVKAALEHFLTSVRESGELEDISPGQARLDLLQTKEIKTRRGNMYDLFIGSGEAPLPLAPLPRSMFDDPEYERFSDI